MDEVRRVTVEVSWSEFARRRQLTLSSHGELRIAAAIAKDTTTDMPTDLYVDAEIVDVLSEMRGLKVRLDEILNRKAKP